MKKKSNSKKIYSILLFVFLIYCVSILIKQQVKLNSYETEKNYYQSQIESLNTKKEELTETQENVNSPEYIENIAREKLEMYMPNEKVYVDINN